MTLSTVAPFRTALPLLCAALLAACNGKEEAATNTVAMKDLEVVDGTASDAMTDLDGVQTEGTATAPTPSAGTNGTATLAAAANETKEAENAEVVSDQ